MNRAYIPVHTYIIYLSSDFKCSPISKYLQEQESCMPPPIFPFSHTDLIHFPILAGLSHSCFPYQLLNIGPLPTFYVGLWFLWLMPTKTCLSNGTTLHVVLNRRVTFHPFSLGGWSTLTWQDMIGAKLSISSTRTRFLSPRGVKKKVVPSSSSIVLENSTSSSSSPRWAIWYR